MKRKNLVRVSATMLAMVMAVAPLAGCRGNNATSTPVTAPQASSGGNATLETDMDLMDYLSTNYASSQLPEDYNQPMLNLPADYVFEFDWQADGEYKTDRWDKNPEFYASVPSRYTPIGDVAVGEDVADAVWYFAAHARNTTGAELVVDGGNTIQLYPIIPH